MPIPAASSALNDITVLDLTRVRAGPTCVRQLADWGARVIKIELPEHAGGGKEPGAPWESSDFQNLQRNKRSLTLDTKQAAGRQVLLRLVEQADVLVENFRPDVKHRLGIDYGTLSAINPRLIYGSISGFGQDGPLADRPGFDQIAQGMGGLMSVTGLPGQGPVRVGIPIADLCAGLFCAQGILVALHERERSGQGQWVSTSLLEAMLFMLDFQATRWLVDGEVPQQAGNNHPTSIPTGVFQTADGYINIAVSGEIIWQRFCQVLDAPEWLAEPDYKTEAERSRNRDRLNAAISERILKHNTATWVKRINEAGVPCGEVFSIDQAFANPQVAHLGLVQSVHSARLGELNLVGQPIHLSRTPSQLSAAPPERGEHSEEILLEMGFDPSEIKTLKEQAVV